MTKFFLILFASYLPIYFAIILFLRSKIKGYTVYKHVVSMLATAEKPWSTFFNVATFGYGFLSLILPFGLIKLFGTGTQIIWGAVFLGLTGITTSLVGIFPMTRKDHIHIVLSAMAFVSAISTGVSFIPIYANNKLFFPFMWIVNYSVILITILLCYTTFFRKTHAFFEWLSLIGTLLWNFLLATSLYLHG